jgi:hypothetical protein
MATLAQDIYNIRNIASRGSVATTDSISEAQIEHWVHYYREQSINEYFLNEKYRVDALLYQKLGCLELESIDMAECPCGEVEWGCQVKRVKIPKTVDLHGHPLLDVYLIDGMTMVDLVSVGAAQMSRHARFTGKRTRTFIERAIEDGMMYLYVLSHDPDLMYLKPRGVFADPTKVVTMEGTPGNCVDRCYDMESDDYPMSGVIRAMTYKHIMERELQLTLATVEDILNNNRSDKALLEIKQLLTQIQLYGKKANPGTKSTTQGRDSGI